VSLEDFKTAQFSIDSRPRNSIFFPKDFWCSISSDNLFLGFTLGKGEYASLLLDAIIDSKKVKLN